MQPNEAAAQGRIADIPMIIGSNAAGALPAPNFTTGIQSHSQRFASLQTLSSSSPVQTSRFLSSSAPTSTLTSLSAPPPTLSCRYEAGLFVAFGTHSIDIARLYAAGPSNTNKT